MSVCRPDTAIWPDPSVLPGDEPDEITEAEEHAAWVLLTQQVEAALDYAWTTLRTLTAGNLAICPTTVRPCRKSCAEGVYWYPTLPAGLRGGPTFWPSVTNGIWTNIWCGHDGGCGCSTIREIQLPGPVGEVVSVVVDGVELDPMDYRVDDNLWLVRQDGEGWPLCQDFNLPNGEVGTWSVTYFQGASADLTGDLMAGILASEYLKGLLEDPSCRLPAGTINVARQGVNFDIEKDMFEGLLTGIPEVDAYTARFNPYRRKSQATFFNPDSKVARQTTFHGAPEGS